MTADVVLMYRALIRARLRDRLCDACGHSLEGAVLTFASDGTALDDHTLSDSSAARLLAATERLSLICVHCGQPSEVGTALPSPGPARAEASADAARWDPRAVLAHQRIIRDRVEGRTCPSCHAPLETAALEETTGGTTLPEFAFEDERAAEILAWTETLTVRCSRCDALVEI